MAQLASGGCASGSGASAADGAGSDAGDAGDIGKADADAGDAGDAEGGVPIFTTRFVAFGNDESGFTVTDDDSSGGTLFISVDRAPVRTYVHLGYILKLFVACDFRCADCAWPLRRRVLDGPPARLRPLLRPRPASPSASKLSADGQFPDISLFGNAVPQYPEPVAPLVVDLVDTSEVSLELEMRHGVLVAVVTTEPALAKPPLTMTPVPSRRRRFPTAFSTASSACLRAMRFPRVAAPDVSHVSSEIERRHSAPEGETWPW